MNNDGVVKLLKSASNKMRPTKRAPDAGVLRKSQAVSYASAFFQSDGVPPPAPARVTQTVSWLS
jgi:hypothetical protein